MTKGQEHLLKLLKEIDQICRENDIQYFCAGGTLIGAVRHRGFVPWDDDADLYMTRDNFLKFLEVAKAGKFPPNRELGCQELDRRYCNSFARYIDTSATAIHRSQLITEDAAGEVIDIFQLDPIPDDALIQKRHFERLMVYSELINLSAPYLHRYDNGRWMYFFYKSLAGIIGTDNVLKILEKKMFSYSEEDCNHYFMRWGGAPLVFDKKMFEEVERIACEDTEVTIPRYYNDYLIYHYGDEWCEVPNISEQMSHEAVRCLGINYECVRKTYQNVIDKSVIKRANSINKSRRIRTAHDKHVVADKLARIRGIRVAEELKYRIRTENIDLQEMYRNNQYNELTELFSEYYGWQGHSQVSGRDTFGAIYRYLKPILIELPLPILVVALQTQLDIGKAAKVYRTIEIYNECKGELPEELRELKEIILVLRHASTEYTLKHYEEALELLNSVLERSEKVKSAIVLKIRCLLALKRETQEIATVIDKGLYIYPNDVELNKLKLELQYSDDVEKLYKEYSKIQQKVVNGFSKLDMQDCKNAYLNKLFARLANAEKQNDFYKMKRIYNKLSKLKISSDDKIKCIEHLLNADISEREFDEWYKEIKMSSTRSGDKCKMDLCQKLFLLANEEPQVAAIHAKTLFLSDKQTVKEEIKAVQSQFEENNNIFYQLQKYYADILYEEGCWKEAYKEYRICLMNVDSRSLAYNEIVKKIKKDIAQIEHLKTVGAYEMLYKNISAKFDTEKQYEELRTFLAI